MDTVYFVTVANREHKSYVVRELLRTDAVEARDTFRRMQVVKRQLDLQRLQKGIPDEVKKYTEMLRPLEKKYLGIIYTKSLRDLFFNIDVGVDAGEITEKATLENKVLQRR